MKRFIISVLCVTVFFIGLGGLVKQAGAKFKSDEKALVLVRQARIAIGGDANIESVKSFTVKGKTVHSLDFNGEEKTEQGDFETNLALPNQFSKMIKIKTDSADASGSLGNGEEKEVVILRKPGDPIVLRTDGGKGDALKNIEEISDGKAIKREIRLQKAPDAPRGNEILRMMLGLFLTAPEGSDVEYFYAGSGSVDGSDCEIVEAKSGGNSIVKIYLGKSNNLPLMMSYQAVQMPRVVRFRKDLKDAPAREEKDVKVLINEAIEAPATAEISVKFSDFRNVGGLQLPFVWTQSANGKQTETISIESFEINPANIAEKFKHAPQRMREKIKIQ